VFFTKFINFLKINKALPLAVLIPYLSIAVAMISSVVHAKVPLQANPASVAPCANSVYPALRDKRVFCLLTVSSKQKDRRLAVLLFWRKRWDSNPRYQKVQLISSLLAFGHLLIFAGFFR